MLKTYIKNYQSSAHLTIMPDGSHLAGGCLVNAHPEPCGNLKGYRLFMSTGYSRWMGVSEFEKCCREITHHERQLLTMTDAEAAVAAISDGQEEG